MTRTLLAAMLALASTAAMAEVSGGAVKVVVLTDMTSGYAPTSGQGSVTAAELAVEDFGGTVDGAPIEVVSVDHQNKVDVGALQAGELIDTGGADLFVDISNSAVSLAVQDIVREADKTVIHVGSATAALYGEGCSPNGGLWLYDTYALAQGIAKAIVAEGGDSWYFITADYAFGHAMEEAVRDVIAVAGGETLRSVRHPVNNTDYASFILSAQSSGAKVIGLANASGDTVNAPKQAGEFGVTQAGQKLAALIFYVQSAKAVGPEEAQGLQFLTGYYWDRDERAATSRRASASAWVAPSPPRPRRASTAR